MSISKRAIRSHSAAAEDRTGFSGARLRARRKELGLSLKDLAERTDLTASFLSLVERGRNTPSLGSLHRIAEALDVAQFHFSQLPNDPNPVVRRQARVKLVYPSGNVTSELLVPNLHGRLEVFITRTNVSAGNIARTPVFDSEECLYLIEGRLRVVLAEGEHVLEAGDAIYFHGNTLCEIRAEGDGEAVFLSAVTPPII